MKWISAGVTVLAGATFLLLGGLGLAMEDAHVHMALAEHLFEDGLLSLVRGEPSAAGTSPGWVLLNAVGGMLLGNSVVSATILGGVSLGVLLTGVHRLLRVSSPQSASGAVVLLAWTGPVLWHAFSGMETLLFLGACIHALSAARERNPQAVGAWASLAILLRLEGLVFAILVGLYMRFQARCGDPEPTSRKSMLWMAAGMGTAAAALFWVNWSHVGGLLPVTGEAKRFLWGVPVHGLAALPWLLERSVTLGLEWGEFWYRGVSSHGIPGVWTVMVSFAGMGVWSALRSRDGAWALLGTWALVVHALYALELPVIEVAGRYQAVHLLLLPIAAARGWTELEERRGLTRVVGRVGCALLLGHLVLGTFSWAEGRDAQRGHLANVHAPAGDWLRDHNPHCLPILLGEVGWISRKVWTAECSPQLVDYYGLVNPESFHAARKGEGLSEATAEGPALFAFSLLGGSFPAIHLQLEWLDAPPNEWKSGDRVRARERRTGRTFQLEIGAVHGFKYPENRRFHHPVGQSTAMNPVAVGRMQRLSD